MLDSSICGSNNKVHNVNFKNSAGLDLKGGDAPQGSFKISYYITSFFLRLFSIQNPILIYVFEISFSLSHFVTFKILRLGSTQKSDLG